MRTNVGTMPVSVLAGDLVARVPPDADLWEIAGALDEADVGALAVGAGDDVDGIVSERDVVKALARRRDPSTTTARRSPTPAWSGATLTRPVAEVAEEMMEHYVRHVLVEDAGRVVGIVSARDLLGAYAAAQMPEVEQAECAAARPPRRRTATRRTHAGPTRRRGRGPRRRVRRRWTVRRRPWRHVEPRCPPRQPRRRGRGRTPSVLWPTWGNGACRQRRPRPLPRPLVSCG